MPFTFTECTCPKGTIQGLYEIQPKVFGDSRGYFLESYSKRDFFAAGLQMTFVQDNQSFSTQGVLRGLHFQTQHPQGKLVRAIAGKVFDVAVDLRNDSPTFGMSYGTILCAEKQNQFYIPEGFAHGFFVLSETALFAYKCTDFYYPEYDAGLLWNDKNLNIDWQKPLQEAGLTACTPSLSEKDTNQSLFNPEKKYFTMQGTWQGSET